MKLKTLPQFLQDQFKKVLILGLTSLSCEAFSQNQIPGLIETLDELLLVHRKQYENVNTKVSANTKVLASLGTLKDIKLDPYYVRSLVFHSNDEYLKLAATDECKFYSLLENHLLKNTLNDQETVVALVTTANGSTESTKISKKDFLQEIYKRKCFNNREFTVLFNDANIQKTVESIKMSVPLNNDQCSDIHKEWLQNAYTPYLCKISSVLKPTIVANKMQQSLNNEKANFYRTKINSFQRTYIENLCSNLNSAEKFCHNYLKGDVWTKIANGEMPAYKMTYKCADILKKPLPLSRKDLSACALRFNEKPEICTTEGSKNYPSNYPFLNCNDQSDTLLKSKLVTPYQDCPGNIDNEGIINFHRLSMHFNPRTYVSSPENCATESNYTYARTVIDAGNDAGWPLKVCYLNRVENKEQCTPYIPGSRDNENLSEDKVIAQILYQHYGSSLKTACTVVDNETYNPLRSNFKAGCFIVYDKNNCTTLKCDKKIILDEKTIPSIRYEGVPTFDYLPSTFMNERYALSNLIKEKMGVQSRTLQNVTDLKFYLDQMPQAVVHGVGCAEDLVPELIQRIALNQCKPLPFIIDSHITKDGELFLSTRLAIDNLHSPRLLRWSSVYNAVAGYKELHPLNSWTLYGLKK